MTLADTIAVRAPARTPARLREVALVVGGSLVVALCAQLVVRLPWTPVPITGQTLGVLLVGAALGARRGLAALALYIVEGGSGLPFFAGGAGGPLHLLGPTGGYLVGFPVAAWVVGRLAERGWDRRPATAAAAMSAGTAVLFAFGIPWLAAFVGWQAVWAAGLLPFLPGAAIKIGAAAAALPLVWRVADRGRGAS